MSLVTVGLAEVLSVCLLDCGVLMGLTESLALVLTVKCSSTESLEVYGVADSCGLDGLATAVDAAAGAAHDFYEVNLNLACLDHVKELSCVGKTGADSSLNGDSACIVCSELDAFHTTNLGVLDGLDSLVLENLNCGTESCFHNAAGGTEDNCSTGGLAEDRIKVLIGEIIESDACTLDHTSKLTGGKSVVNISIACCCHFFSAALELLSGTGHDSNGNNVLRVNTVLLCIPGLDHSTLHLLGALAGREVGNELRIVMLAEVDPSGRAGGDHGESAAVLYSAEKLGAFFHDGKVCTEVGVKYLIKAKSAKSSSHLAGY